MIKLALLGATGRMGSCIASLLADDERFDLVAALTASDDPRLGETIRTRAGTVPVSDTTDAPFDVLIDFSVPKATVPWLDRCRRAGAAMVIGVTGYTVDQQHRIVDASRKIAILQASNFSVGVNLLLSLVGEVARRLGDAYDIEIVEQHHGKKVDAPSGTAIALTDAIVEATDRDHEADVVHGRHGVIGERPSRQIGVHAIRMGDVVGVHAVHFSGPGETISLQHRAHSRDAFARGAIEAAAWMRGRKAGMYTMIDVLPTA